MRLHFFALVSVAALLGACSGPKSTTAAAEATAEKPTASAAAATPASTRIFRTADGLAIRGYDPVSYFSGAPVPGDPAFVSVVDGATFRFASAENKAAFDADPAAYLPQYGGYCAYGASQGAKFPTDPSTGTVVGGKLYFNKNPGVQALWNKDRSALIEKADQAWPAIQDDAPRG